jgi:hypothetical protein
VFLSRFHAVFRPAEVDLFVEFVPTVWLEQRRQCREEDGGVAANPSLVVGQIIPVRAFRALRPGQFERFTGYTRYVTADV